MKKIKLNLLIIFIISYCIGQEGEWINISPFDSLENENKGINGSFISEQEGWIYQTSTDVGHTLYHTTNGGDSWSAIYTIPDESDFKEYFLSLQFVNEMFGIATIQYKRSSFPYEDYEYFMRTVDGGYNWEDLTNTTFMFHGGDFWLAHYFIDINIGFARGPFDVENQRGRIYKTVNSGVDWYETNVPSLDLTEYPDQWFVNKFFFLDELHGWAVCTGPGIDAGMALKTLDGGETWEVAIQPGPPDMFDVHFFDENHGGVAARNSHFTDVILTEDNFDSQSYHHYIESFWMFVSTICYQNLNTIWVSGDDLKIFKSNNSGATFNLIQEYTDLNSYAKQFQCFDSTIYLFAHSNMLLKYEEPNEDSLFIDDQDQNSYKLIQLSIFPNPVNGIVNIQYQLNRSSEVSITVFDILGKSIESQRFDHKNPGIHNWNWEITNIPSGEYIVKVRVGADQELKKITVIK